MKILKLITSQVKYITQFDIVKVFSFTAISTLVRMLTGFISVKVVAVIIGPSGLALLGQLNSFSTIVMTFATGGLNSGITKYISQYKKSASKTRIFISTAFVLTVILSITCGLILILFPKYISTQIFLNANYSIVILIFGVTVVLYALNNLILSILNGYKEYKKYVQVGIVSSIVGLVFTIALVLYWGLNGAMIAAVTYQSIMFFVTIYMLAKLPWFRWYNLTAGFSFPVFKKYINYSLMTFVNVATIPVSQIIIRSYSIKYISIEQTGLWEAMNRISGMYLMVFSSSFLVYYLPRLSELNESKAIRHEVITAFKFMIPVLTVGFTGIFLFRHFIVRLLFTSEFYPVEDLFLWQLIGDFLKMSSWLLTFIMIAKSMTYLYVVTEISCYASLTLLCLYFARHFGIIGITQAYMINYILYMILVLILFRKLFRKNYNF